MFSPSHTSPAAIWAPHVGACLMETDGYARYGAFRHSVAIQLDGLTVRRVEVSREDIDANNWPGDTAVSLAALAADGVDIVEYDDMDECGRQHTTWRLVTAAAVAASSVTSVEEG